MNASQKAIQDALITIMDFPKEGIVFRDITGLLLNPKALKIAGEYMKELVKDIDFDAIIAIDARGFFFATYLAVELQKPMLLARKKGKLPRKTCSIAYDLEYGSNSIEIHEEDLQAYKKFIVVDDLIATGGTAKACVDLAKQNGGEVCAVLSCLLLSDLPGKTMIEESGVPVLTCLEL